MGLIHAALVLSSEILREPWGSLGAVNYCRRALIGAEFVKFSKFQSSDSKRRYFNVLASTGAVEKAVLVLP